MNTAHSWVTQKPVPCFTLAMDFPSIWTTLYAMGAQDKVVQRILRHARPHVTKECYDAIANMKADGKTFEPVTPDAKEADKKARGEAWER